MFNVQKSELALIDDVWPWKINWIQNQNFIIFTNYSVSHIFNILGLESSQIKIFLVRAIVRLTAIKGRVGGYLRMTESEMDLFYYYFPKKEVDAYERI